MFDIDRCTAIQSHANLAPGRELSRRHVSLSRRQSAAQDAHASFQSNTAAIVWIILMFGGIVDCQRLSMPDDLVNDRLRASTSERNHADGNHGLMLRRSHSYSSNSLHRAIGSGMGRKNSLCMFKYPVHTLDGDLAPSCNLKVCAGRDDSWLLNGVNHTRRWSDAGEKQYMEMFHANQMSGWLQAPQLQYVKTFTAKQHEMGLYGAVGEIGVHHGKFLIPIVGNALVDEPAVAVDLFEKQQENVDGSGYGSTTALLKNLKACDIPRDTVTLLADNSMHLTVRNFTSGLNLPAFRMLSIDGGHTVETTLHDLMMASCLIREGGLVALDDFLHPTWIGVTEALVHFARAQDHLVPFMHGYNKIWLTTRSHVQQYREFMAEQPEVFPCRVIHQSRRTIGGHDLCYTGPVAA